MIRRILSPVRTPPPPPRSPRSHKQMAARECGSHMSGEERQKQSFHLYLAAVTPPFAAPLHDAQEHIMALERRECAVARCLSTSACQGRYTTDSESEYLDVSPHKSLIKRDYWTIMACSNIYNWPNDGRTKALHHTDCKRTVVRAEEV